MESERRTGRRAKPPFRNTKRARARARSGDARRVHPARPPVPIAISPTGIVIAVRHLSTRLLPFVAGTTSERVSLSSRSRVRVPRWPSRHYDRDRWSRSGHDSACRTAARRLANRSLEDRNP